MRNDIDTFILKILQHPRFRWRVYLDFVKNCYELKIETAENVSPDILNMVIKRAKWSHILRNMLPGILAFADADGITNDVFQGLLRLRGHCRVNCLSVIAHFDLSFYQMWVLNQYPLCYEAFSWLFDKICRYDFFTLYDMQQLLDNNPDVQVDGIRGCIRLARKNHGSLTKIEFVEEWLREQEHETIS